MAQLGQQQSRQNGPAKQAVAPGVTFPPSPVQEAAGIVDALTTHQLSVQGEKTTVTVDGRKVETWKLKKENVEIWFRQSGTDIVAAPAPAPGTEPKWQSITGRSGPELSSENYRASAEITGLVNKLKAWLGKDERDLNELRAELDATRKNYFGGQTIEKTEAGVPFLTLLMGAKHYPEQGVYRVEKGNVMIDFLRKNDGMWYWRDPLQSISKFERYPYEVPEHAETKENFFRFEITRQLALLNRNRNVATIVENAGTKAEKIESSRFMGERVLEVLLGAKKIDGSPPTFEVKIGKDGAKVGKEDKAEKAQRAQFKTDENGLWQWSVNGGTWQSIRFVPPVPAGGDANVEKLNAIAYYLLPLNAALGEK